MDKIGVTVVETAAFLRQAKGQLSEAVRSAIVDYVASNPEAGSIMESTGGVRKIRWGSEGRGKSGGVRVVYYYHNTTMPIFLLAVFAKNEKANLTATEKAEARKLVDTLVSTYRKRGGEHAKKTK